MSKTPPPQPGANALLNKLMTHLGLKNDAGLSRALKVAPPVISKIRNSKMSFGDSLLIRAHMVSDLAIRDMLALLQGEAA